MSITISVDDYYYSTSCNYKYKQTHSGYSTSVLIKKNVFERICNLNYFERASKDAKKYKDEELFEFFRRVLSLSMIR